MRDEGEGDNNDDLSRAMKRPNQTSNPYQLFNNRSTHEPIQSMQQKHQVSLQPPTQRRVSRRAPQVFSGVFFQRLPKEFFPPRLIAWRQRLHNGWLGWGGRGRRGSPAADYAQVNANEQT